MNTDSTIIPRAAMTDAVAILKRMAGDLRGIEWTAETEISESYFTVLGWSQDQVRRHGPAAIEAARNAAAKPRL